ncbi:MAG TPA: hypothetical protein VEC99_01600 [Clostridia bacterium]|nr:hypothetical protein [Clostridia bacterium]
MTQDTEMSYGRRWFLGAIFIAIGAGPILAAVTLSSWLNSLYPTANWMTFVVWAIAVVTLILLPAYVTSSITGILRALKVSTDQRPSENQQNP